MVMNTLKGLFRYNRMAFGVASGAEIFQEFIENVLQGCKGAAAYLDDIVVTEKMMSSMFEASIRYQADWKSSAHQNTERCFFMADSTEYLGFLIEKTDQRIFKEKTYAIS